MKTAVSIPDELFINAERLAKRFQTSRSDLYARALAEFVARHDDDQLTTLINRAVSEASADSDAFVRSAARHTLQGVEW